MTAIRTPTLWPVMKPSRVRSDVVTFGGVFCLTELAAKVYGAEGLGLRVGGESRFRT